MPKSKETLNRRKIRLLDFGDRLLRGLTGGKSLTGGLIFQSAICTQIVHPFFILFEIEVLVVSTCNTRFPID